MTFEALSFARVNPVLPADVHELAALYDESMRHLNEGEIAWMQVLGDGRPVHMMGNPAMTFAPLAGALGMRETLEDPRFVTPDAVAENRGRVSAALSALHLVTVHQTHSADAIHVTEPWTERPRGDAMVTSEPGLALCILTADCTPVQKRARASSDSRAPRRIWARASSVVAYPASASSSPTGPSAS